MIHGLKCKEHLVEDDKQSFEPHLSDVRLQGPQGASGRLLEVVSQLRTRAVLQHLHHQGEQLLPQTDVVVHHLGEATVRPISIHVLLSYQNRLLNITVHQ